MKIKQTYFTTLNNVSTRVSTSVTLSQRQVIIIVVTVIDIVVVLAALAVVETLVVVVVVRSSHVIPQPEMVPTLTIAKWMST